MSVYKEYGGFLQMEFGRGRMYHANGIYLNSARHALKYIIRAYDIKRIAVSYFTCPVIWRAIEEESCEIVFYDINKNMQPELEHIGEKDFIICNNYFGINSKKIQQLAMSYPNMILDNAQAFFSPAYGMAAFYSPRKFFGIPDGGIAISDRRCDEEFDVDVSFDRCTHLLKRHDLGANAAYSDFCDADDCLNTPEIKYMSSLTTNMLAGVDNQYIKKRRRDNFDVLHDNLAGINSLRIEITKEDIPMAYPLLIENANIKQQLIAKKIYIPTYWPQLEERCPVDSHALYMKKNLIPLPLDQRYEKADIIDMLKIIKPVLAQESL